MLLHVRLFHRIVRFRIYLNPSSVEKYTISNVFVCVHYESPLMPVYKWRCYRIYLHYLVHE